MFHYLSYTYVKFNKSSSPTGFDALPFIRSFLLRDQKIRVVLKIQVSHIKRGNPLSKNPHELVKCA
jgi:hypothetical protein